MATSSANNSAARYSLPQTPSTTSSTSSDKKPELSQPPLVKNKLPYTREQYEKLGELAQTPLLNFLFFGKIPEMGEFKSQSPAVLTGEFAKIFTHCLLHGETDAIEFLWRESGLNPDNCVIHMEGLRLNEAHLNELQQQCNAHTGLRFSLSIESLDPSAISGLSNLIRQGKIVDLNLSARGLAPESLRPLASVLGQVENNLTVRHAVFDLQSEIALAESLSTMPRVKNMTLNICDFGASKGLNFVKGMQMNDSVISLSMCHTMLGNSLNDSYGALISKNSTIISLHILAKFGEHIDVDSILHGALNNNSLESLSVGYPDSTDEMLRFPEILCQLVEKNKSLTRIRIPVSLLSHENQTTLAQSIKRNTSLIYFDLHHHYEMDKEVVKTINDVLDRNFALAHGPLMRKAGQAFDPYGTVGDGMEDAGTLIARNVLQNSSSLNEFADTMAVVELSMRELIRMQRVIPQTSTRMTTDTTAGASITTNTTTTTTSNTSNSNNTTTTTTNSIPNATTNGGPDGAVTITTSTIRNAESSSAGPKSS